MHEIYEQRSAKRFNTADPIYLLERPYDNWNQFSWSATDLIFKARATLSALFPGRTAFDAYQFIALDDIENGPFMVPLDYVLMAQALRPMLTAGFTDLFPGRIKVGNVGDSETLVTTYYLKQRENVVSIPGSGAGYSDLDAAVSRQASVPGILIGAPLLHGCRLEDYVELASRHPDEFYAYALAASRCRMIGEAPPETIKKWLSDLELARVQLDITLQNKRAELAAKGLDVAVGITCSIATFVAPLAPEAKAMLMAMFSAKTLYDGGRAAYDYVVAKDLISDKSPFWFIWKALRS